MTREIGFNLLKKDSQNSFVPRNIAYYMSDLNTRVVIISDHVADVISIFFDNNGCYSASALLSEQAFASNVSTFNNMSTLLKRTL